eukprot:2442934-Amphidinium_carterae.1
MSQHFTSREWIMFRSSRLEVERPWSARLLAADNKVAVGWTQAADEEDVQQEEHPIKAEFTRELPKEPSVAAPLPVLRLEGTPGESFFRARAALYARSTVV